MKKSIILLSILSLFLSSFSQIHAFKKESYMTLSVPVEAGKESVTLKGVDLMVKEATFSANSITFYLDYDTVRTASMAAYFKKIMKDYPYHRIGLWTKVSTLLLQDTTPYQGEKNLSVQSKTNLTGYFPEDRSKLIDQMSTTYLNAFGTYPTTILDDYIDSTSAKYWSEKYGVIGGMNMFGELGLKMTVSDNGDSMMFNRYFPYLISSKNGLAPGRARENTQRFVISPGFSVAMNPNIDMDIASITDKRLSEMTYLGIVVPVGIDSHLAVKKWLKLYVDLLDKHSLRWSNQDVFSDLYLARYPYYTPAFSRELNVGNKKYWIVLTKDYFASIDLSDGKLATLNVYDDATPENYWFEYNKQDDLGLDLKNLANGQAMAITSDYEQGMEYSRTWIKNKNTKIDFQPDKIVFEPKITGLESTSNTKISEKNNSTVLTITTPRNNIMWPFLALGIAIVSIYVIQRRR